MGKTKLLKFYLFSSVLIVALSCLFACGRSQSFDVEFSSNVETIESGNNIQLSWSSQNASRCYSNDFDSKNQVSGTITLKIVTTTTYTITCSNSQNSTISKQLTVSVSSAKIESSNSAGATYYVANNALANNSNTGASDAPWRNIQFAIDQLVAGDTLIIKAGIYEETVLLSGAKHSGIANAPIRIQAQDGAVIDGSHLTPKGSQGLITLQDVKYVTIDNIELRNFRTASGDEISDTPIGIYIKGASAHLYIANNYIHHIENRSNCGQSSGCGTGANGIAVYGDTRTAISDIVLSGNEISHCILSSSEAFTLNGNIDGFKVLNNYVHDNNNIGIDIIGYESDTCSTCAPEENRARNGLVQGNKIINNSTNLALGRFSNNPWYEGDDGSAGGFYVDGGRNIVFDRNISSKNDIGFEFASEHSAKFSEDILMRNNLLFANREAGLSIGGYAQDSRAEGGGGTKNIAIFNNTFYKNKGWGTEINFSYRISAVQLANNIIVGEGDIADNFSSEINAQNDHITWLNNLWWATNNSDTSTLQGSFIAEDPLFIAPTQGNLHLQTNSVVIDRAIIQAPLSTWKNAFWQRLLLTDGILSVHGKQDIYGNSRFNNRLDIGAEEVIIVESNSS
ncbi:MAG: hypothetical protein DSZ29_02100 [Aquificaceae bacterium]|nr:MAG: hypothetical protein DSZ29_02100 [Aquificaceae bacterium]